MAKKNAGGATGSTAPAPAAKAAPATPAKPGIFSKLATLILLTLVANSATGRAADRYAREHLTAAYRRIWMSVFAFIFIVFAGFLLNLAGAKEINIFLALFFTLLIPIAATRPDIIMNVFYGGVIVDVLDDDEKKGVKSFFILYGELLLTTLFAATSILTVLGFFSFKENPMAFPAFIILIVLILQMKKLFKFTGQLGAKSAYVLAICMFIFQILTLIPGAFWLEKTGRNLNPRDMFSVAEDKDAIYRIKTGLNQNRIKANAKKLKDLQEAVEDGAVRLTQEQEKLLEEAEKDAQKNSTEISMIRGKEETHWETQETKKIIPNKWSRQSLGKQQLFAYNFPNNAETIKVMANGVYRQAVRNADGRSYSIPVNIKTGIASKAVYQNRLPMPNRYPGCGLIVANGRFYSLGEAITLKGEGVVYFTTNFPQNWNDTGVPAENFVHNSGEVEVSILTRV